jgi:hypothetical protein
MSVHYCSNPRTEICIRWIIHCRGINFGINSNQIKKTNTSPGQQLESLLVTILSTIQQANSNRRFLKSDFVHQLFDIVGAIPLKELPKCKPWRRIHFTRSLCNRSLRLLKLKRREYERAGATRTRLAGCIVLLLRSAMYLTWRCRSSVHCVCGRNLSRLKRSERQAISCISSDLQVRVAFERIKPIVAMAVEHQNGGKHRLPCGVVSYSGP